MSKFTFISPHLDDAVLSCGQLIAAEENTEVITICAGLPKKDVKTDYDMKCGFKSSYKAMTERRSEDIVANYRLGSPFVHLNFLDGQYDKLFDLDQATEQLEKLLQGTDLVIAPLGLKHLDHVHTRNTLLDMYDKNPYWDLWLYEELPYRVIYPDDVQATLTLLRDQHELELQLINDLPLEPKTFAIHAYKSQIYTGDINPHNVLVPERYWKVYPKKVEAKS